MSNCAPSARLVIALEVNVDELRRLTAEDDDEQCQRTPPESPRPRTDADRHAGWRRVSRPAEIIREFLEALHNAHRLIRESAAGSTASRSSGPSRRTPSRRSPR